MDQIKVRVKGGYLVATASLDRAYPGIDVEYLPDVDEGEHVSAPRVLFEYPEDAELRALIWTDKNKEDYTHKLGFTLDETVVNKSPIEIVKKMVDDEYNCLTLCSGSLNADPNNNVAEIVRKHCDRIAFAHIRNVKHFENGDFSEASHRDCDGDTGILEILKAYHDCGFEGYIRPDHGRHLWDEVPGKVRPGYGLYDRALGIMYMLGVWDSLEKFDKK